MKYLLFELNTHNSFEFTPTNILAVDKIVQIKGKFYKIQTIIVKPFNNWIIIQANEQ